MTQSPGSRTVFHERSPAQPVLIAPHQIGDEQRRCGVLADCRAVRSASCDWLALSGPARASVEPGFMSGAWKAATFIGGPAAGWRESSPRMTTKNISIRLSRSRLKTGSTSRLTSPIPQRLGVPTSVQLASAVPSDAIAEIQSTGKMRDASEPSFVGVELTVNRLKPHRRGRQAYTLAQAPFGPSANDLQHGQRSKLALAIGAPPVADPGHGRPPRRRGRPDRYRCRSWRRFGTRSQREESALRRAADGRGDAHRECRRGPDGGGARVWAAGVARDSCRSDGCAQGRIDAFFPRGQVR